MTGRSCLQLTNLISLVAPWLGLQAMGPAWGTQMAHSLHSFHTLTVCVMPCPAAQVELSWPTVASPLCHWALLQEAAQGDPSRSPSLLGIAVTPRAMHLSWDCSQGTPTATGQLHAKTAHRRELVLFAHIAMVRAEAECERAL